MLLLIVSLLKRDYSGGIAGCTFLCIHLKYAEDEETKQLKSLLQIPEKPTVTLMSSEAVQAVQKRHDSTNTTSVSSDGKAEPVKEDLDLDRFET